MNVKLRTLALLAAIVFAAVFGVPTGADGAPQTSGATGSTPVTGIAMEQTYRDGADGLVYTYTRFEVVDSSETVTVRNRGGVHSNGLTLSATREPNFEVGKTYRMNLTEFGLEAPADIGTGETIHWVAGAGSGVLEVTADGRAVVDLDNTPDNYTPAPWTWDLSTNVPVMVVNPNSSDLNNEVALMQTALDTWEDDPGSSMDFTYGGTSSLTVSQFDNVNVIYWADTPDPSDSFLAQARTWFDTNTGEAVDSDITFNTDFTWVDGAVPGAFDTLSVGIHELGHTLGLDHAPNPAAIMYFSISSNTVKRQLSLGDQGGVAFKYPPTTDPVESVAGNVGYTSGALPGSGVKVDLFSQNRAAFLGTTTTDSNGDYSFQLPASGCYVITFIAPDGQFFQSTGTRFQNSPFCASEGEAVTGIGATLVDPATAAAVTGTVDFTDGSPLVNGKVNLFTAGRASFLGVAFTDAAGDYSFNLPGPGCYVVTFIAPDGETFQTTQGPFQNTPFCASAGETVTGIDASLLSATGQSEIGGVIGNAFGLPVANVRVVVYEANGDGTRGRWLGRAFSEDNGDWRFPVAAGCYVADLIAPAGLQWAENDSGFLQRFGCVDPGATNFTLNGVLEGIS
jgi:hypothetical protein